MSNFTSCEGREHKTTIFFFLYWISIQSLRIQLQKKNTNIWRIEGDGISAIKFEAERLHILSDVFVAIAIVVFKLPFEETREAKGTDPALKTRVLKLIERKHQRIIPATLWETKT